MWSTKEEGDCMALHFKNKVKVSILRGVGTGLAVAALLLQPVVPINIPAAFAVNSDIAKVELETGASQEIEAGNRSGKFSVRLKNEALVPEQPAVKPEITTFTPVLWNGDNYKGVNIDTNFVNVTGLQGVTVTVKRADGSTVTKTMKQARIDAINAANGATLSITTPFVIQEMTYSEAASGSWSLPSSKAWTAATAPVSATISFVFADSSKNVSATAPINNGGIDYISLLPPVDSTPQTTLVTPTGIVGSKFKITGTATDNEALNRVYVQLVNREDSKRYGGTTVNLIGKGVKADWSVEYDTKKQNLPEGRYAAHVSVVDMKGNTSSQGWSENFIVDATGPVFGSVVPATGSVTNKDFIVTADVSDAVSGVQKIALNVVNAETNKKVREYAMTKGADNKWSANVKLADLDGDAVYDLRFRAVDAVNNVTYHNNRGGAYLVNVDTTSPVAQVVSPSDGDTLGGTVDFKITASDDNLAAYSYRIGNVDTNQKVTEKSGKRTENINNETVYSWDTKKVADGQYYLYVSARDAAGNRSEHRINVTVDNTAPKASLTSTNMNPTELRVNIEDVHPQGMYAVNVYTKDHQLKGVICRGSFRVGETSMSCATDVAAFKSLPDGEYYFKANVVDAVGNNSAHGKGTTAIHPFTIDRTPPAQVTGLAIHDDNGLVSNGFTNDFHIVTKWEPVEDAAYYEYCYWNSIATSEYREVNCYKTNPASNQQSGSLNQGEGVHYVKVRAIDAAGNLGEWSKTVSFIYDTTPPDVQLNASISKPRVGDKVEVTGFVTNEPHIQSHTFEITLPDGTTKKEYISETTEKSHTFTLDTSAGAGEYKISYIATDRAGNRSDAPNSKVLSVVVAPADKGIIDTDSNPVSNPVSNPGSNPVGTLGPLTTGTSATSLLSTTPFATAFATQFPGAATPAADDAADNDEGEVLGESTIKTQDDELDRDNDGEVLAAQDSSTSWSVVNALLAIMSTVMGVIALLGLFARRAEGEESKIGSRIISVVLSVGMVVGLFLVEDFTAPMAIVNIWTLLFAAIVVTQAIIATMHASGTEE